MATALLSGICVYDPFYRDWTRRRRRRCEQERESMGVWARQAGGRQERRWAGQVLVLYPLRTKEREAEAGSGALAVFGFPSNLHNGSCFWNLIRLECSQQLRMPSLPCLLPGASSPALSEEPGVGFPDLFRRNIKGLLALQGS